jgi:hypothetical protein
MARYRFGLHEQPAYLRDPGDDVDPAWQTPVLTN